MKKTNLTLIIALLINLFTHPIIAQTSPKIASDDQANSLQEEQNEQLERQKLLQEMDELKLFLKNHIEDIESTYRRNIMLALRGIECSLVAISCYLALSSTSRSLRAYLYS